MRSLAFSLCDVTMISSARYTTLHVLLAVDKFVRVERQGFFLISIAYMFLNAREVFIKVMTSLVMNREDDRKFS